MFWNIGSSYSEGGHGSTATPVRREFREASESGLNKDQFLQNPALALCFFKLFISAPNLYTKHLVNNVEAARLGFGVDRLLV